MDRKECGVCGKAGPVAIEPGAGAVNSGAAGGDFSRGGDVMVEVLGVLVGWVGLIEMGTQATLKLKVPLPPPPKPCPPRHRELSSFLCCVLPP